MKLWGNRPVWSEKVFPLGYRMATVADVDVIGVATVGDGKAGREVGRIVCW